MGHQVFVCYASEDREVAERVCSTLEAQGVECWIAPRNVTPGMDYAAAIIEAISDSRVLVLVFSEHANQSPHVRREVERASSRGVGIVPFRIDDVPLSPVLEYFISGTQWLDALGPSLEPHLEHLALTVKSLLLLQPAVAKEGRPRPLAEDVPIVTEEEPAVLTEEQPELCQTCGAPLRAGARFCRTCGRATSPAVRTAAPVTSGAAATEEAKPAAEIPPVAVLEREVTVESPEAAPADVAEPAGRTGPVVQVEQRAEATAEAAAPADPVRRTMSALVDALVVAWGTVLFALLLGAPGLAIGIALAIAYLWAGNVEGRTLGKRIFHLAAVRDVPGTVTPLPAAEAAALRPDAAAGSIRTLAMILGLVPLGFGFWQVFVRPDHRTWHDTLSATVVVETVPETRSQARPGT
jgi:uncharacterized RDD family membrane protein YckC